MFRKCAPLPAAKHEQPRADGRERGRLPLLGCDTHGLQVLPPATAQRALLVQHPPAQRPGGGARPAAERDEWLPAVQLRPPPPFHAAALGSYF